MTQGSVTLPGKRFPITRPVLLYQAFSGSETSKPPPTNSTMFSCSSWPGFRIASRNYFIAPRTPTIFGRTCSFPTDTPCVKHPRSSTTHFMVTVCTSCLRIRKCGLRRHCLWISSRRFDEGTSAAEPEERNEQPEPLQGRLRQGLNDGNSFSCERSSAHARLAHR